MQERISTRALVEGALFAALTALLALIGIYIPPLQFITNLVWTLPIIILIIRNGTKVGVMATFVAGLLVFLFSDPMKALFLFMQFGALGIVYGVLFKNGASAGKTLFYGTVVSLISTVISFSFSFAVTGIDIASWKRELEGSMGTVFEMYKQLGLVEKFKASGISEAQIKETLKSYIKMFELLIPGIVVVSSLFAAFINFVVARMVLRRLSFTVPELPPFRMWRLPWYWIWVFIVGLSIVLAGNYAGISLLTTIGKNILYIYFPLVVVIGVSVCTYYFKSKNVSPLFKGVAIFMLLINFPLAFLIILSIGLFDPLLDYRKLLRRT